MPRNNLARDGYRRLGADNDNDKTKQAIEGLTSPRSILRRALGEMKTNAERFSKKKEKK